jgi:hypothetical protein
MQAPFSEEYIPKENPSPRNTFPLQDILESKMRLSLPLSLSLSLSIYIYMLFFGTQCQR